MRKEIVGLLDQQTIEGVTYRYQGENGIRLYFDFETEKDAEQAIVIAKRAIKATSFGFAIFFQMTLI